MSEKEYEHEGDSSLNNNSNSDDSYFREGTIVLTKTNYICRVRWTHRYPYPQAGVEYLEMPSAYNVYPLEDLVILADGAKKPMFEDVSQANIAALRKQREHEQKEIEKYQKKKTKMNEKDKMLIDLIKKIPEDKLLELIKDRQ